MEQTRVERDMDVQEIKRICQQIGIGTLLALAGILFLGICEAVARWIES